MMFSIIPILAENSDIFSLEIWAHFDKPLLVLTTPRWKPPFSKKMINICDIMKVWLGTQLFLYFKRYQIQIMFLQFTRHQAKHDVNDNSWQVSAWAFF